MQVTEANTEGLKRTLKVVVGADELGRRFSERLDEIKGRVQLKGFRKGKVPVPHLKKMYGRSLMVEVLQDTVRETSNKALAERKWTVTKMQLVWRAKSPVTLENEAQRAEVIAFLDALDADDDVQNVFAGLA